MKLKTISLITLSLVLLALVVSLLDRGNAAPASDDPLVGQPLVETDALRGLSAIEVIGASGNPLRLELLGNSWVVDSEGGLPADFSALRRLINPLAEGRIDRFVTALPGRKESLNLDQARLKLEGADGQSLLDLRVGRSASRGGVYVQPADSDRAYLFDQNLNLSTTVSSWIDRTPLDFTGDDVRRISIDFDSAEQSAIVLERFEEGAEWTLAEGPESTSVIKSKADQLARNLASLRFTSHVARSAPEAAEALEFARRFEVETFNGTTATILAGRRPAAESVTTDNATSESPDDENPETEEAAPVPAGTPYFFLERTDEASPWSGVASEYAFEFPTWSFEQLPDDPADLLEFTEPGA